MNTLKATISRLREMSYQTYRPPAVSEQQMFEQDIDALVNEIERMTGDSLYRGRPLGEAALSSAPDLELAAGSIGGGFVPPELAGVEILEGRFERTNDRLVGMFEEGRSGYARGVDWSPNVINGLRADLASISLGAPAVPLLLNRSRQQLYEVNAQLQDPMSAGSTAALTRRQILATAGASIGAQANNSDRVVESLLL